MGKKMRFKLSLAMPHAWFYKLREMKKLEPAALPISAGVGFCRNAKPNSYSSPVNHKAIDISFPDTTPKRCSPHLRSPRSTAARPQEHNRDEKQQNQEEDECSSTLDLVIDSCLSFRDGATGAAPTARVCGIGEDDDSGDGDFPGFSSAGRTSRSKAAASSPMALALDVGELERRLKALGSEDRRKYYVSPMMLSEALPSPNVPDAGCDESQGEQQPKESNMPEHNRVHDAVLKPRAKELEIVYEDEQVENSEVVAIAMVATIEEDRAGNKDYGGGDVSHCRSNNNEASSSSSSSSIVQHSSCTPSTTSTSDTAPDRGFSSCATSSYSSSGGAMWERGDAFSSSEAPQINSHNAEVVPMRASVPLDHRVDLRLLAEYTSDPRLYLLEPPGSRRHRKPYHPAQRNGNVLTTHNTPLLLPESEVDMELATADEDSGICTALIVPAALPARDSDASQDLITGEQIAGELMLRDFEAAAATYCTAPPLPPKTGPKHEDPWSSRRSRSLVRSHSEPESVLRLREVLHDIGSKHPRHKRLSGAAVDVYDEGMVERSDHLLVCSEEEEELIENEEEAERSGSSDGEDAMTTEKWRRRSVSDAFDVVDPLPSPDDGRYGRRSLELGPGFSSAASSAECWGLCQYDRAASETEMGAVSNYSKFKQQMTQRRMWTGSGGSSDGMRPFEDDAAEVCKQGGRMRDRFFYDDNNTGDALAAAGGGERGRKTWQGSGKSRSASPPPTVARRQQAAGRKERRSVERGEDGVMGSRALVKSSYEPGRDFKESMEEMIREKGLWRSNDMVELLQCYLALNADRYHDLIVKVFTEVWSEVVLTRPHLL